MKLKLFLHLLGFHHVSCERVGKCNGRENIFPFFAKPKLVFFCKSYLPRYFSCVVLEYDKDLGIERFQNMLICTYILSLSLSIDKKISRIIRIFISELQFTTWWLKLWSEFFQLFLHSSFIDRLNCYLFIFIIKTAHIKEKSCVTRVKYLVLVLNLLFFHHLFCTV